MLIPGGDILSLILIERQREKDREMSCVFVFLSHILLVKSLTTSTLYYDFHIFFKYGEFMEAMK